MSNAANQPPAGWYPDPSGEPGDRYWDGVAWSESTREPQPGVYSAQAESYPQHWQGSQASRVQVPLGQGRYYFAGIGKRIGGYIIDSILLGAVQFLLLSTVFEGAFPQHDLIFEFFRTRDIQLLLDSRYDSLEITKEAMIISAIATVIWSVYRVLLLRMMSATIGQRIFKLRVAELGDENLGQLSWKTALLRGVGGAVAYQVIGVIAAITVLILDTKQTIHELLAKAVTLDLGRELR